MHQKTSADAQELEVVMLLTGYSSIFFKYLYCVIASSNSKSFHRLSGRLFRHQCTRWGCWSPCKRGATHRVNSWNLGKENIGAFSLLSQLQKLYALVVSVLWMSSGSLITFVSAHVPSCCCSMTDTVPSEDAQASAAPAS